MGKLDVFYQVLRGTVQMDAANAQKVEVFTLPISRIGSTGRKVTIIEVLWIDMWFGSFVMNALDEFAVVSFSQGDSTSRTTEALPSDGDYMASIKPVLHLATNGGGILTMPLRFNLQGTDGFGYLVAADKMTVYMTTAGQANASTLRFQMTYRFVDVPVEEYIGIVSSINPST